MSVFTAQVEIFVENLLNRSVRLDILATDASGRKFNVEIQRSDEGGAAKNSGYLQVIPQGV